MTSHGERASPDEGDAVRRRAFRLRVAIVMAAVSLAGAYVTFVAGDRSATASDLEGLASQQWAEEQQADQQIDAQLTQDQMLTGRLDIVQNAYVTDARAAAAASSSDPGGAAELRLQAQESAALYAQLAPFFRAAQPTAADDGLMYDAATAEEVLRVQDPRLYRASSALTRSQAAEAADLAARTGGVIVLLVGALFVLTLAHIAGPRRGVPLAWLGGGVAVVGVVWFVLLGPLAAIPLLVAAAVTVGALAAVGLPRVRSWLAGFEASDPAPDAVGDRPGTMAQPDLSPGPTARFDRAVVVVIAVATLLGAGVGFLHSQTARAGEQASWRANDDGVSSIGALRSSESAQGVAMVDYEEALAQRVAAWNSTQRALTASAAGDQNAAAALTAEASVSTAAAERLEARSGLTDDLGTTGIAGFDTLGAVRASVWLDAARVTGEQDAANAAARNQGERAGWYLSVLAWIAVAVYLLGLSLAFTDGRARAVLAAIGVLLVIVAAGQTVRAVLAPQPVDASRASAAAETYAEGVVELQRNDATAAEASFTRALELRPDFGLASRERASAILARGSAAGMGLRSGFTDDAVDRAIADLEAARDHGADTAGVLLNLGAMLFHRAVNTASIDDLRASAAASREGLSLAEEGAGSPAHPHINAIIGRFNLALSLLGAGDEQEALETYRTAGAEVMTLPAYLRPYLVSAALAPLDLLDHPPFAVSDGVRQRMKDAVVAAGYGMTGDQQAQVESVTADVFPAQLQWRAEISDFDAARDHLAVQWYRLDRGVGEWGAVPVLSGPLTLSQIDAGGQFFRAADDQYWGNSSATLTFDAPPSCVRAGRYRVELYLNGSLAGSAVVEAPPEQSTYVPLLARDVGAAMCALQGWTTTGTDGVSRGIRSADSTKSVTIYRVQQAVAADVDPRAAAIDRLLAAGGGGLPVGAQEVAPAGAAHPAVFGGKPALWRTYAGGGASTSYAAVQLAAGTVLVARASGPTWWTTGSEAWQLLGSTTPTSQ